MRVQIQIKFNFRKIKIIFHMIQLQQRQQMHDSSCSSSSLPKSILPPSPIALQMSNWGLLNSIQIYESRVTEYDKNSDCQQEKPSKIQCENFSGISPVQCASCKQWNKWSKIIEQKMLKMESILITKEIQLNKLIKNLKETINQKHKELITVQKEKYMLKQQYQEIIMKLQISNQGKQRKQGFKGINRRNEETEGKGYDSRAKVDICSKKTIKFGHLEPAQVDIKQSEHYQYETLKTIKPSIERYLCTRKSHTQQTITDCSFIGDYQPNQGELFNHHGINQRNPQKQGIQDKQQKLKISKLLFENENLRSYNKVLLQKLSNSKLRKY